MNQKWNQMGTVLVPVNFDPNRIPGDLPPGIYNIGADPGFGCFVAPVSPAFPLPPKLYALNRRFIERCKRTFRETDRNLGILMNGTKGTGKTVTGKTVTGKVLANELRLPVLIVSQKAPWLVDFLSSIQQDIVVFFDEFEKVYRDKESRDSLNAGQEILTLMDGVASGGGRKLFLLTTNATTVDQNLLQRPGRIRYLKQFGNLEPAEIREIVEDRLLDKNRTNAVVDFIATLTIITIDIVTAVVDEVNIHGENPEAFADVFNAERNCGRYDVMEVMEDGSTKVLYRRLAINLDRFSLRGEHDGTMIYSTGNMLLRAIILEVFDYRVARVRLLVKEDPEDGSKDVYEEKTICIEPSFVRSKAFSRAENQTLAAMNAHEHED